MPAVQARSSGRAQTHPAAAVERRAHRRALRSGGAPAKAAA